MRLSGLIVLYYRLVESALSALVNTLENCAIREPEKGDESFRYKITREYNFSLNLNSARSKLLFQVDERTLWYEIGGTPRDFRLARKPWLPA